MQDQTRHHLRVVGEGLYRRAEQVGSSRQWVADSFFELATAKHSPASAVKPG